MMRRLIMAFIAVILAGCAQIDVTVDVLDPSYVDAAKDQPALLKALAKTLDEPPPAIAPIIQRAVAEGQADYRRRAAVIRAKGGELAAASANSLEKVASEALAKLGEQAIAELTQEYDQITKALGRRQEKTQGDILAGREQIPGDIIALLREREAVASKIKRDFDVEFRGRVIALNGLAPNAEESKTAPTTAQSAKSIEITLDTLLPGGGLANSAAAYFVASAPVDKWKRAFNRTLVEGRFGNLDTAIKLEDVADFTVKGVTFDPSKVAQVASKATVQGLLIASQVMGVPIRMTTPPASGEPGAALATSSGALADEQQALEEKRSFSADYRRALLDIADAILAEQAKLTGGDAAAEKATRSAAVTAIRATFDANASRLSVTSDNKSGSQSGSSSK
jgi:hypothetical protein